LDNISTWLKDESKIDSNLFFCDVVKVSDSRRSSKISMRKFVIFGVDGMFCVKNLGCLYIIFYLHCSYYQYRVLLLKNQQKHALEITGKFLGKNRVISRDDFLIKTLPFLSI